MNLTLLATLIGLWSFTGINFSFWLIISFTRYTTERLFTLPLRLLARRRQATPQPNRYHPADVAVIMAAHNESISIGRTIEHLLTIVRPSQIYIGSDASTDDTVKIARSFGCHVADINPNRGKAKVLTYLLEHYQLYDRYRLILILDADILVDQDMLTYALPQFNDPNTAAIAGHTVSIWSHHRLPRWSLLFTAYRIRLWRLLEYGLKYGQSWKYLNVSFILPGASSIYRTDVLRKIDIDAPGLTIEDFNMTFEVHHQKLGRIGFDPRAFILDQEPYSLRDYTRQVTRWNLGWWQTVRRHGFWFSLFSFFTISFQIELLFYSLFFLLAPAMFIWFAFNPDQLLILPLFSWLAPGPGAIALTDLLIGVFVIDYCLTILVTLIERKPLLLVYGLLFPFIRFLEAFLFLYTIPLSILITPSGSWKSPARR